MLFFWKQHLWMRNLSLRPPSYTPNSQHSMHSLSSPSSPLDGPSLLPATPPPKVPAAIVSQPQVLVANHVQLPIYQLDKGKGSFWSWNWIRRKRKPFHGFDLRTENLKTNREGNTPASTVLFHMLWNLSVIGQKDPFCYLSLEWTKDQAEGQGRGGGGSLTMWNLLSSSSLWTPWRQRT